MISYRTMRREELDTVLGWAAEEGWNPGVADAAAFWAADPEGFFVACDADIPVAAISVVVHNADFAFLGLYICRRRYRGRGIGLALWQHALTHAGGRTVGLDGVPAQQANYEASGFHHAGETVRHVGRIAGLRSDHVRAARAADIPALIALDAQASGWSKPAYMAAWFASGPTRTTFVYEQNGTIDGVVTVRRCKSGAKIGPLIASSLEVALKLMRTAGLTVNSDLSIDVPARHAQFTTALLDEGFSPIFRTARMYRGDVKDEKSAPQTLYAVTSLELG